MADSGSKNVFEAVFTDVQKGKRRPRYSPVKKSDTVIGQASELALRLVARQQELDRDVKKLVIDLMYETDGDMRQTVLGRLERAKLEQDAVKSLYIYQMRLEFGNWAGPKLTIRTGGKVVITTEEQRLYDERVSTMNQMLDAANEAGAGGDPSGAQCDCPMCQLMALAESGQPITMDDLPDELREAIMAEIGRGPRRDV